MNNIILGHKRDGLKNSKEHNLNVCCPDPISPILSVVKSSDQKILADIYQDNVSMVIWERPLTRLADYSSSALSLAPNLVLKAQDSPEKLERLLKSLLPEAEYKEVFLQDIRLLMDMFACLFDLEQVGLRLNALSGAMCPRFHVDKIPCRLVTSYQGNGTEWLEEADVVREQLGRGGNPANHNSGLSEDGRVQRLQAGDVAIMKGDNWPALTGHGVVHRSPVASLHDQRLFLSLDMV
ncbi:DUF1826 domain-containing protein [Marinomonas transparens]|uniref:DUF1826 domain-containing protein n=1 Tax=Marinomonas transparens TaxID=2795388 RepID=A0A934N0Z6_9GAMM|nr:DUF1826 domain-containing protein [Marinomonas transparens]MBJ7537232.1 DUF1826 domain-containing protein [Marinomonas transparens]